ASALSLRLEGIYPSLGCRGRERFRAPYGWPCPKRLRRPIQNLPDRQRPLPHRAQDYKNRLPAARHRARQIPRCLNRSREIDSTGERPPRPSAEFPSVPAIRFDTGDDTDGAARTALSPPGVDWFNNKGNKFLTFTPLARSL